MQGNSPDEEHIDEHGECQEEIYRLRNALAFVRQKLQVEEVDPDDCREECIKLIDDTLHGFSADRGHGMSDEKMDALTDMAWHSGARHAIAALSAGMSEAQLSQELEARVTPARRWLAENRCSTSDAEVDGG